MAEWTLGMAVGIEAPHDRWRWRAEAGGTHLFLLPALASVPFSIVLRPSLRFHAPHDFCVIIIDRTLAFAFCFTTSLLFSCVSRLLRIDEDAGVFQILMKLTMFPIEMTLCGLASVVLDLFDGLK